MTKYNAELNVNNPVDFFHYIEPTKKLMCASYDPHSGILCKTYSVLRTDGKRYTMHIKQRIETGNK